MYMHQLLLFKELIMNYQSIFTINYSIHVDSLQSYHSSIVIYMHIFALARIW